MVETANCKNCGDEIPTDVSACPECGNDPTRVAKGSGVLLVVVGIVILTQNDVLGAVVVLLGVSALLGTRVGEYSPTRHSFG